MKLAFSSDTSLSTKNVYTSRKEGTGYKVVSSQLSFAFIVRLFNSLRKIILFEMIRPSKPTPDNCFKLHYLAYAFHFG